MHLPPSVSCQLSTHLSSVNLYMKGSVNTFDQVLACCSTISDLMVLYPSALSVFINLLCQLPYQPPNLADNQLSPLCYEQRLRAMFKQSRAQLRLDMSTSIVANLTAEKPAAAQTRFKGVVLGPITVHVRAISY